MEIESQWTARRREQVGVFPTIRMRSAEETPAQAKLGRGTLESKMNAIARATRQMIGAVLEQFYKTTQVMIGEAISVSELKSFLRKKQGEVQ